jgi:hypothetical protein
VPDETSAQSADSDLLGDLDIAGPLSGLGDSILGGDADSDFGDASGDGDVGDQNVVYDDVDQKEFFTIDADTGEKDILEPSQISDSAQVEVVDDHQDNSIGDDSLDDDSLDDDSLDHGLGVDDSDVSITSAVDLSPSDSFEFEED